MLIDWSTFILWYSLPGDVSQPSEENADTIAYAIDFAVIAANSASPKIAAMKRVGPESKKFKEWKHQTEAALISLLGRDSIHARRFSELEWPDEKGREFVDVVDEASVILDTAMQYIWRMHPGLKKLDVILPGDHLPPELSRIIAEIQLCLKCGAYSAAVVMARKAVEAAIYLRFEQDQRVNEILTSGGDTLSFEDKVARAQSHGFLSPQRAKELKRLKLFGDSGAHSWRISIGEDDAKLTLTVLKLCLQELYPQRSEGS